VVTYMFQHVIEFWNKKLFLAFYLWTNNIMYLMHITFVVYYKLCIGKTWDPFILKVLHIFMISFFFFPLLGLDLKYRLWSTWLRMSLSFNIKNKEDGFEFKIGWDWQRKICCHSWNTHNKFYRKCTNCS
jgi:hypothetical protein